MSALIVLGHGSSKHPASSIPVRRHTRELKSLLSRAGDFDHITCAFLKEEPSLETLAETLDDEHLVVLPDFLAEGYFTRQFIPAKLRQVFRGRKVTYLDPIGTHPAMAKLIYHVADQVLRSGSRCSWREEETTLLLVGHGSNKNAQSKDTLHKHIRSLRRAGNFAHIADVWLEEEPFLRDWKEHIRTRRVLVLPCLLANGQHGDWDVRRLLDLDNLPTGIDLKLAPALGQNAHFSRLLARHVQQADELIPPVAFRG